MDDLRLPQKTLNDYFELLDYQRDFLALKAACEQMQAKLAKIKIATNDPDSVDNIIDDAASSLTTTYSSEKIVELFGSITNDTVTAKEKIVTAINAKKPSCNAKVSDTWDLLSFYISLMGNLQFNFKETVLNKVRMTSLIPNVNSSFKTTYNGMTNPYIYKPMQVNTSVQMSNDFKSIQPRIDANVKATSIAIFLGNVQIY